MSKRLNFSVSLAKTGITVLKHQIMPQSASQEINQDII